MKLKKIVLAGTVSVFVFMLAGCMSMILEQYKKIEPCAFTINPPTKNDFVMLLPDAKIKSQIIGTWKHSGVCQIYSEIDINGQPFMYLNTPGTRSEETMEFLENGNVRMKVQAITTNPQTQEETVSTVEQVGTWTCENGLLRITAKNTQTNEDAKINAVAIWPDDKNMEFRIDVDSLHKTIKEATAKAKMPEGGHLDGIDCHYDDDGNFYMIIKSSFAKGSMTGKSKVTTKQPPKMYVRQN